MTPKIIDKDKKSKEIAMAAMTVFAEKGFDKASMREVAKAAGVGKGTIYEYFDSKEELFYQTMLTWVEMMEEQFLSMPVEGKNPIEIIRMAANSMMDEFLEDDMAIKLGFAFMEAAFMGDDFLNRRGIIRKMMANTREWIKMLFNMGVDQGYFKPEIKDKAEEISINMMAYLDGITLHYFIDRDFIDVKKQVNVYMDTLLDAIKV